jgi:hypothetical protein
MYRTLPLGKTEKQTEDYKEMDLGKVSYENERFKSLGLWYYWC